MLSTYEAHGCTLPANTLPDIPLIKFTTSFQFTSISLVFPHSTHTFSTGTYPQIIFYFKSVPFHIPFLFLHHYYQLLFSIYFNSILPISFIIKSLPLVHMFPSLSNLPKSLVMFHFSFSFKKTQCSTCSCKYLLKDIRCYIEYCTCPVEINI